MYYDAKECGKRIKEQIKVMGYTQEAFAESVNISIQHLLCAVSMMFILLGFSTIPSFTEKKHLLRKTK